MLLCAGPAFLSRLPLLLSAGWCRCSPCSPVKAAPLARSSPSVEAVPAGRGPHGTAAPAAVRRRTPLLPPQPGRPPAAQGSYLRPRRGERYPAAHFQPGPGRAAPALCPASTAGGVRRRPEEQPSAPGGCWRRATGTCRRNVPPRR